MASFLSNYKSYPNIAFSSNSTPIFNVNFDVKALKVFGTGDRDRFISHAVYHHISFKGLYFK